MAQNSYCRRLSQSEAYARLLAMRQGQAVNNQKLLMLLQGREGVGSAASVRNIETPEDLLRERRSKTPEDLLREKSMETPRESRMGMETPETKLAVQNFRDILIDIEKQQALQRNQLKRVME
jgi:hypothetical protein